MATSSAPVFRWMTAEPLWNDVPQPRQPAILRFDTEDFIGALTEKLTTFTLTRTIDLTSLLAQYEIASERPPGPDSTWGTPPTGTPIRLYQPAHGRFYLVAASLVCELPGMPDRCVDLAGGDQISFVLRRIEETDGTERAWTGTKWATLNGSAGLVADEQELPLSAIRYTNGAGQHRRLLIGFIPTASREAAVADDLVDNEEPRGMADATARILDPYQQLLELTIPDPTDEETAAASRKDAIRFFLLDTADFLNNRLHALWGLIQSKTDEALATANAADKALFEFFEISNIGTVPAPSRRGEARQSSSWRAALNTAWEQAPYINGTKQTPDEYELLDVEWSIPPEIEQAETDLQRQQKVADFVSKLRSLIEAALTATPPPSNGESEQTKGEVPKYYPVGTTRYVLRCVYRQAPCMGIQRVLVSEPTQTFTVAPYYDPDAPARPIRIALPEHTSLAALRKSKKNVSFVFSDNLRDQISRATNLSTAFKGKVGSGGGFSMGRICSFSIPIVSLCAMIVLMIFINLLNIVFWWKPFLKICLPIPKPRANP